MFAKALSSYFDVIASPKKAFETIFTEKLPVWVPLVLILLVTYAGTFIIYEQAMDMQIALLEVNPDVGEDQMDQAMQGMEMMKSGAMKYFGAAMPVVITPIFYAISALLILLAGNFVFGGKAKFADLFTLVTYSSAVGLVSWVAQLLVFFITGNAPTFFSGAAFLPLEEYYTTVYALLSTLDIFMIWSLIVTGIGINVLYRFDMTKSMAIPLTPV